ARSSASASATTVICRRSISSRTCASGTGSARECAPSRRTSAAARSRFRSSRRSSATRRSGWPRCSRGRSHEGLVAEPRRGVRDEGRLADPRAAPHVGAEPRGGDARAGEATERHYHARTEEIYVVVKGSGELEVDGETAHVRPGDAILIPPGAWHTLANDGTSELRILCCCVPPYSHEDTFFS